MNLRLANVADIPFMVALERACPAAAHWPELQYRELFQAAGRGPERLAVVVEAPIPARSEPAGSEAAPGLLGFLVARHLAPEWELENIVVAPAARRQGLGGRLLEAWLARVRETGSEAVFLEVRESNAAARRLYENVGFQPTGRRRLYYADPPEDAVLYRRSPV